MERLRAVLFSIEMKLKLREKNVIVEETSTEQLNDFF